MSEQSGSGVARQPRRSIAAGQAVMQALEGLDTNAQHAVLKWARSKVWRRARVQAGLPERKPRHPVTMGEHDAQILQWAAEGLTNRAIAERLECSTTTVGERARLICDQGLWTRRLRRS